MTEKQHPMCEVVMSRRPTHRFLLLCSGSLVWYYCGPLQKNVVSLVSDILFTLVCALGLLGFICRQLHLSYFPLYSSLERARKSIPVDPLEWQVTPEAANDVAACIANTVGAAEGVLRVAASGRDSKLFTKVVLVLYLISAIGRSASGATVAYCALCFAMIVPYFISKVAPEITAHTPTFLQKKFNKLVGSCTPGNSPMSNYNSPRHF